MAIRISGSIISKEGFLFKKGGIIKSWSRRYFVLSPQSLCYFRSEVHEKLEPLGRIFLSDIVSISTESTEKKKAFVFVLHTKKRAVLLQGANNEDRDKWVECIKRASEIDKEAETKDPFRKSLRRLTPGVKRVTIFKDPQKGIGCTIKNAAGHIFVNRILEDGPIAETGVLRPGDEILDIHGETVSGKSVSEVVEIIRQAPTEFLATVRPITSVHKALKHDFDKMECCSVVHQFPDSSPSSEKCNNYGYTTVNGENSSFNGSYEYATVREARTHVGKLESPSRTQNGQHPPSPPPLESNPSLEDVGNYDDEEEGDVPPPLPEWTEDALILVDPPPLVEKPKLNIYNTNAHMLLMENGKPHPMSPSRTRRMFSKEDGRLSNHNSPIASRHSPPNIPPPVPGKLVKCRSQDALDQIDARPPVPPRLKRTENGYRSPGARPRFGHLYNDTAHDRRDRNKKHQYEDIDLPNHHYKPDIKYADLSFSQSCNHARR